MTYKQGSFLDSVSAGATFIALLHTDLLANGWTRVETVLDSGAFRWEVYRNPAANNSIGLDFYMAIGLFYPSGTAGTGNPAQAIYFTIFEDWNTTTKQATRYPVWSCGASGLTAGYLPTNALTPRALPASSVVLPLTNEVLVSAPGSAYTTPPTVAISPVNAGTGATGTAVMELGTVVVVAGGTGYPANQTALACTLSGGGGSGAVVTAVTNGSGVVTAYNIVDRGTGYTSVPTVTVTGGGSGATSTVRLQIKSVSLIAAGSGYTAGGNTGFSGGGGSGASVTIYADPGFAYGGLNLGATSTQYFYSVTADRVAFAFRANGASDQGGYYLGVYDRLLHPDYDPVPIVACNLTVGTTTAANPTSGFGFSTREPRRSPYGRNQTAGVPDCAVMSPGNFSNGGSMLNPGPGAGTEAYSGLGFVQRANFGGRGSYLAWRGLLKGVVTAPSTGTSVVGDTITWQTSAVTYYATRASANTFIVQS
jgi:hypothetical protein